MSAPAWRDWTSAADLPIGKDILFDMPEMSYGRYHTGRVRPDANGHPLGVIAGRFMFDVERYIVRWIPLAELLDSAGLEEEE